MKNLLLSICIVIASLAITLNAQNMVVGGDFEGLGTLHQDNIWTNSNPSAPLVSANFNYTSGDSQWRLKKSNTGYIRSDFYTGDDVYNGTQSLKFAVNSGYASAVAWYNNAVYQSVVVDPAKTYEVKLWAKGNARLYAQFYTYVTSSSSVAVGGQPSKVLVEEDGWAEYTFLLDVAGRDNSAVPVENFADKTIFTVAMATAAGETTDVAKYVWVDNIEVKEKNTTGIENPEVYNVSVYVNNKKVYFNFDTTHKVSVYSIVGSLVKTLDVAPGQSLPIEVEGCYLIKVESADGKVSTQKIVIK